VVTRRTVPPVSQLCFPVTARPRVSPLVHRLSYWLVGALSGSALGRHVIDGILRVYYRRARHRGLTNIVVPLWYRWLRTYYFATLRTRLPPAAFQRKYWELGSLTDYRRYEVDQAEDVRILRFLEELVTRARGFGPIADGRPLKILEVGCGGGRPLRVLRTALDGHVPVALFGVDISMHGLLLARDAVGCVEVVQGSVTQLPFRRRFDLAFCRGVLLFLDGTDVARAFSELARACQLFVLTEPANVRGEPVDTGRLDASLRREDFDQTSWIHPYARLAAASGGTVLAEEYISGNYLMVVEWQGESPCCAAQMTSG